MIRQPIRATVLALVLAVLGGCGTQPPAASGTPVTEAEARAMIENMLAAYNSGDYAAWSRDWSDAMRGAIPESAFQEFRTTSMAGAGRFQSIESLASRPGQAAGVTRWEATAQFENGRYVFYIAFNPGSRQIDGVNLSPAAP